MQIHGLLESFNYAFEGLIHTFKTQRNMKIHFSIAFLVMLTSLFLDIGRLELIILFASITFVVAMELVNTAIEIIIDMISQEYRFQARVAKNIAAGAVLMAAINAVVVGYLIFQDQLKILSLNLVWVIKNEPTHLIFINLGLLFILIIALKAWGGKGTPLQGGMPSGHSAIAAAIFTMITLLTGDIVIATLVFILMIMVVQSRLESRTHSLSEVITGVLIGILLTIILFGLL